MPGNIAVLILAFNMMAVCVCDCIPKCSSDLRGLQMFKLTMKIKYFPYQKLAFLMNCSGVSKGDMEILAFSGFCLVFTLLFLPAPLSPAPPSLAACPRFSLSPLPQPHASFSEEEGSLGKEMSWLPHQADPRSASTVPQLCRPPKHVPQLFSKHVDSLNCSTGWGQRERAVSPCHLPLSTLRTAVPALWPKSFSLRR